MTDDKIRAAWEAYHGPVPEPDGYIPATPPAYERGYRDGAESIAAEVRSVIDQLDRIDAVCGDGAAMTDCRDRLRALLPEGK